MTTRRVQKFQKGDGPDKWSAEALNAIRDAAEMVLNLHVESPLRLVQTKDRMTLSLSALEDVPRPYTTEIRRALVVETPVDGELLKIRLVRYKTNPPELCTGSPRVCKYQWASDVLECFPDFGKMPTDYESWDKEEPEFDATFYEARKEFGYWVLTKGSDDTPIQPVRITSIIGPPNTSERLNVVKVKEDDQGAIVDDGAEVEGGYATWYDCFGRHYGAFIGRTPPVILPALFVKGDWRVLALHRFKNASPSGASVTSVC